jgi:hypothetical protein
MAPPRFIRIAQKHKVLNVHSIGIDCHKAGVGEVAAPAKERQAASFSERDLAVGLESCCQPDWSIDAAGAQEQGRLQRPPLVIVRQRAVFEAAPGAVEIGIDARVAEEHPRGSLEAVAKKYTSADTNPSCLDRAGMAAV